MKSNSDETFFVYFYFTKFLYIKYKNMTSRYIEIRPDNIPADGKISFKNGFPVLSFTISAQDGLLDPSTIRIVGNFNAYKDNLPTPTPLRTGDLTTMNNRLGIYNVVESLTIRAVRSKMICENIRHYSKYMNSYLALNSSLQDQMGHLGETCLIMPNSTSFRQSVMESPAGGTQTNACPFRLHDVRKHGKSTSGCIWRYPVRIYASTRFKRPLQ